FPVRLVPPPAWKARPGEMHLALDPGAHATDTISVSVPEAARPGTYELAGEIRSGPVPLRLVLGHLRVVLPVAAPRVLPLRIDGELGEWGELGPAIGPDAVAVGTVADAADLSAEARFSWCAAGLLLAVRVADQVVANPNRMTKPWVGDAVEVFVDARPPEQRASPDAAGVRQYFLVPPTPDCPRASWFQARPEAPADGPLFVAGRVLADGYAIEALLPWPADAPPPGPGTGVYLNLAVDDLDEPPGADDTNADLRRKGQIVWSGGADVYRNAAAHVLARLEPSPTGGQRDAAAGPAIETGPEDLPFNGDMDTDVNRDGLFSDADGWGRLAAWGPENGSATWAPDGGLDGSGALRLAAVSNLLAWQSVRYPLRRQAGAHRVEARVRASGLGDGVAAVKLAFYALDGHWIGTPGYAAGQTTGDTSGQWAALDFTVPAADVPAGAAFWRVVCQVKGPAPRAEVLYDRIRVTVRHEPDPLLNHE
ncbi:MAG: hypothetical protein JXR77_18520, partial [Lentisphaeria bacterium]|nr:hypothetical protein [Lentisphaeria bacterium]